MGSRGTKRRLVVAVFAAGAFALLAIDGCKLAEEPSGSCRVDQKIRCAGDDTGFSCTEDATPDGECSLPPSGLPGFSVTDNSPGRFCCTTPASGDGGGASTSKGGSGGGGKAGSEGSTPDVSAGESAGGNGAGEGQDPSANGRFEWIRTAGDRMAGNDYANGIAVLDDGAVLVAGEVGSPAYLGEVTLTSSGTGWDGIVARYEANGDLGWAVRFDGTGDFGAAHFLAANSSGFSYVVGGFSGTSKFGSVELSDRGGNDLFVAKLDPDGAVEWARSDGGPNPDGAHSIALLEDGSLYVLGNHGAEAQFEDTVLHAASAFIAKYAANGDFVWVRDVEKASSVTAIADGTAFLATNAKLIRLSPEGDTVWEAVLPGPSYESKTLADGTTFVTGGYNDSYLTKITAEGEVAWTKTAGGSSQDYGKALALASNGRVYVVGDFASAHTFAGGYVPAGAALLAYDEDGTERWAEGFATPCLTRATGVASQGNAVYAVGDFCSAATFGEYKATSGKGAEIFLAKLIDE